MALVDLLSTKRPRAFDKMLTPICLKSEPADLEICKAALRRFHPLVFVHGDCSKYNFIIRPDGQVVLIDFDKAKACADPALMEAEITSLEGELAETTGRGGGLMPFDEGDSDRESEE
jgi:Ser/Thr protein kinase RdoA (MazF antagonist)